METDMGRIDIRQARAEDAGQIAEIEKLCFPDPWSFESMRQELEENPLAVYMVAEADGEIAAYAGLWRIEDEGHITNVAVRPEYRRQGLGRRIVTALIGLLESQGTAGFTLEVRRSNTAARKMYEELGFLLAGERRGYYEKEKEDALIMWRWSSREYKKVQDK